MVEISISYDGSLRCTAEHGPSGTQLETDAPTDNQGKGERFSPTDLVATALGSCILTTMAIVAERLGVELAGAQVNVQKEMVKTPVRRIGRLPVVVRVPVLVDAAIREKLEQAAHKCPVHGSLHPDIDAPITFEWA